MDCGYAYERYNEFTVTFLIFLVIYGVYFLIELLKYKKTGGNAKNYFVQNKIKILFFFIAMTLLIGANIYTRIKANDAKTECAQKS